ncbi:hypothetical protein TorRG33x02_154610 [Trema orientale]|uniref:Uncharacterized protein n=1 Tax=Trema orientale TaxID=63057 RepID=A0A2P5ETD4_TREOI|nr:hypothetical protein TorRG33x02_154610 [Trema orientale]
MDNIKRNKIETFSFISHKPNSNSSVIDSIASSLLINVGEATLTAVVPVEVVGHEGTGTALGVRALLPEPLDLPRVIDLVELEDGELDLLLLVLDFLGLGVRLLLPLLGSSPEAEHEVEGRLLLDVVVG